MSGWDWVTLFMIFLNLGVGYAAVANDSPIGWANMGVAVWLSYMLLTGRTL
jgi:hypothetical protein